MDVFLKKCNDDKLHTHCSKMATQMVQPAESFPTSLARIGPLPCVAAKVALEVCFPLDHVSAVGALEPHPGQVICQETVQLSHWNPQRDYSNHRKNPKGAGFLATFGKEGEKEETGI